MTQKEFTEREQAIKFTYDSDMKALCDEWIQKNAAFKIGDYIGNVTGIIKVEKITSELFRGEILIHYHGYRYKQVKGVLSRTKDNNISKLTYSLRKIK